MMMYKEDETFITESGEDLSEDRLVDWERRIISLAIAETRSCSVQPTTVQLCTKECVDDVTIVVDDRLTGSDGFLAVGKYGDQTT